MKSYPVIEGLYSFACLVGVFFNQPLNHHVGKICYFFEPPWVLKNKDEHDEDEDEDDEDDIDEHEDDITRLDDGGG